MDETADCRQVRPLLAELATGAATGIDRDLALRHLEGCVACQRELAELALTADRLLLLVPEREPPAGFETAVMNRINRIDPRLTDPRPAEPARGRWPRRRPRPGQPGPASGPRKPVARRPVRAAAAVLVLLLTAVLGAGVAYWSGGEDRQLADRWRQGVTAGQAYTRASPVVDANGSVVGRLYVYPGSPAWAIVSLTSAPAPGAYDMSILTRDGVRYRVGVCTVTGRTGVTGYALPVPVDQIQTVDLRHGAIRLTIRPG